MAAPWRIAAGVLMHGLAHRHRVVVPPLYLWLVVINVKVRYNINMI